MATIFYGDLDKVCRGCLCKNGEMRPLFGSFLDKMLRTVAEIEVHAGDGMPDLMCVPCVLQVSRAFTFKQLCQRSDQTLRTFYREIESCITNNQESDGLNETKAIVVNKTSENNVSSMTIVSKPLDPLPITEPTSNVPTSKLPDFNDKQNMTNQPFNLQYHTSNTNVDDTNLEKCLLIVNNESTELPNSALNAPVNVTDNDIANLITIVAPDENQLVDTVGYACNTDTQLMDIKMQEKDVGNTIMSNTTDDNIQITESIENDIKVDVLSALDSNVMEADLIDEHFGSYSDHDSNEAPDNDNKDDLILTIFSAPDTSSDINSLKSSFEPLSQPQSHQANAVSMSMTEEIANTAAVTSSVPITVSSANKTPKSFECPECHKIFAENKILKRHLKIHNPVKPHVCNVCEMAFAESSNLTKHMKKHTGELRNIVGKPNLCSVCGKGFKWASSLSKHMKHHTRHKILNCPYCTKYYVEARSLNIHLRSHTGEKPFICKVCNKAFTQTGNLEKHMRVHTGEKPYICPICNKSFSQSGYVAIHLRVHTGEKPYACTDCGKAFAGSSTLSIHKRTHTGERPYPCNMCDKTFARQETAIIHQRTHTGEKPHICKICHRGFSSTGHLNGHMRSHSGLKTHECNVCRKKFAGSSSLKVHMKTHTAKNPTEQYEVQNQLSELTNTLEDVKTFYECNVCGQNIPSTVLTSNEALQAYDHEIIDGVLICSNVSSIIEQVSDVKVIEELQDENGASIIITTTTNPIECISGSQTVLSNVPRLK